MSNNTFKVDASKVDAKLVRFGWKWVVTLPESAADTIADKCGDSEVRFENVKCGARVIDQVMVTTQRYVTSAGEVWSKQGRDGGATRVALVTVPRDKGEGTNRAPKQQQADKVGSDVVALLAAIATAQGTTPDALLASLKLANATETTATETTTPAAPSAPKGSRPARRHAAKVAAATSESSESKGQQQPELSIDDILAD